MHIEGEAQQSASVLGGGVEGGAWAPHGASLFAGCFGTWALVLRRGRAGLAEFGGTYGHLWALRQLSQR